MRILVVNTVPTDKNGITNVIFNYLTSMDKGVGIFDYISLNNPDEMYENMIRGYGGNVYVLPRLSSKIISYVKSLRKVIKDNKYDAIHIHGNSHTVALELVSAKMAGCQVRIVHAHSTKCGSVIIHKLLYPLFSALCTHRLACGEEAGRFMFGRKPFVVMNNGIDTDKFAFNAVIRNNIRKKNGWEHCVVIGHVGYFLEIKNQRFLVDVFNYIWHLHPNYRLVMIGEGPLKDVIHDKVESLGLSNAVCMTGSIDNVNEYLNAMDVIAMPSLFEGVPLTLVEQQANGLQCFVSDTVTHEADKTGNITFISLRKNAEAWAKIIMSTIDVQKREERSNAAIEYIKKAGYDIKSQAKVLEAFYKDALK